MSKQNYNNNNCVSSIKLIIFVENNANDLHNFLIKDNKMYYY